MGLRKIEKKQYSKLKKFFKKEYLKKELPVIQTLAEAIHDVNEISEKLGEEEKIRRRRIFDEIDGLIDKE